MSLLTMFGVGVGGQTGEGRREVVTFITVLKKKKHTNSRKKYIVNCFYLCWKFPHFDGSHFRRL